MCCVPRRALSPNGRTNPHRNQIRAVTAQPPDDTTGKADRDHEIYLARFQKMPRAVRIVYGRPRTFVALAIGIASLAIMPEAWRLATRLLVAWDVFAALYLIFAYTTMLSFNADHVRRQARLQDDGRFIILAMTGIGAFASLAAIILELGITPRQAPQQTLAVATIALTWSAIHTTFALHYAHDYYRSSRAGGLAFPGNAQPDYWDFVYFSFVIGMTAQVSDVGITDRLIRRTATAHGIVSFIFNTALLALMVNIAASAI
jgi:uncharacterized membrane protein